MKRTIVIGDLQGMYHEAEELLKRCNASSNDRVIFAGDLVDRGPDNDRCLDLAMSWERRQGAPAAVLGNHEERHLSYRDQEEQGKQPNIKAPSHVATRAQLKQHHYDYMRTLPLFIRLPEHNAAVVHAGAYPGRTLEQQSKRHLLHIQMIDPNRIGSPVGDETSMWPSKAPDHWRFWTNFWTGPERLIFGHSVFDRPLLTDKVCGIDGGACFGLKLHAVILPDWEIVSVQAKIDHGKRHRDPQRIELYNVHGDVNTFS